ncbi:MAG: Rieske (2Fe-2S) protein [Bacteroidales bacterium]
MSYSISKVQLNHVGTLGHYIVENEGLNGIILFRNAEDIWQAFEKTCTYNPDDHLCEVDIEDGSFFSVCPCCDSEFNLVNDGIPQVGPAELPMKQYQVREDNSRVYISN